MSSILGDAYVRIRPRVDTGSFEREVQRGMSSAFKKIAVAASAALAAAGVGSFFKDTIRMASDAEQSIGAVQAVFKDYAGTVTKRSKEANRALGLSGNAYRELATVIGSQLKNAGVPMDELGRKTDGIIQLGADLAAQFGGTTQDAVNALSATFRGEFDPIERYGISLNETALKAQAMKMGLSDGKGALDQHTKVMAAMALVTQQSADAHGAFARESNTAAGAPSAPPRSGRT